MKRVHVENWSTKEKLALASSVLKSGDQNWMSVSRVIRSLGEPNRPPDWFSQKQCAVQYDLLLNNVGTLKRKKRSEKTANENNVDTPGESIVRKLTQERIEELKMLMSEYRALYLKEKRELDDINMGKCDDRLNDIAYKLEQWEKLEEEEQAAFIKQHQEKKQKEAERAAAISSLHLTTDHGHTPHAPVEVKPTSPLLTSLLQSPSPALLHRGSGPTISSLLHSAPSVPPVSPLRSTATSNTNTQTTLSKLLESPPAMIHHRSSPVSSSDNILDNPNRSSISPATISSTINRSPSKSGAIIDQLNRVTPNVSQIQREQQIQEHLQQSAAMKDNLSNIREEQISTSNLLNQPLPQIRQSIEDNILNNIKVEVDELTPVIIEDAMEVISNLEAEAEPVEVVVETAPQNQSGEIKIKQDVQDEVNMDESSDNTQNQTGDSDVLEQLDHLAELDSHAVEMIVVGPNQTNVISVNHDGSSENLEEESNVGTSQLSHENISRHEVLPVDVNVIKEETIEITSSELELTTDDKLDLITSEEAIVLSSSSSDKNQNENEDNKIQVERLVKDLGNVSPSEMKQIIEGAEVIVEGEVIADDTNESIITSRNNEVVNNDNVVIDNNDKSDIVEVTTTTTSNSTDSDSVIETVIDNVIEVGSTVVDGAVVDNNVVQFTDSNSAVIELSEADTNTSAINVVASTGDVTTNIADESQEAPLPDELQSKNYDYDERTIEPDSSSCSIDESDNRGQIIDDIIKDDSCIGEVDKINNSAIDKTKSLEINQLSSLPSSSSSIASPLAMTNIALHLPPSTIEAVSSSSRPDTPSTEEDNEPVANLVKKLPRKASDSVPNSPLSGSAEDGASLRAWKKSIMLVYNRLATHKFASLFLKPITDEQAHGYHSVIHRPMDLSTIKKNVESGVLRTTVEFQRDMLLMFQNAIMYNNSTTLVYERASEMQKECIQHMQLMVEAMGEGVPLRRESLVVDKLITRQRKQDNVGDNVTATPKRKRTSISNIENAMAKRKKLEEQL